KVSKNKEAALDFMRYMTTPETNEEFNKIIGWIPVIQGAQPSDFLKSFAPNFDGVQKGYNFSLGGKTDVVIQQLAPLMQLGRDGTGQPFGFEEWAAGMEKDWMPAALIDFDERDETERDKLKANESLAALL